MLSSALMDSASWCVTQSALCSPHDGTQDRTHCNAFWRAVGK
jgi:hypothetical protein